MAHHQPTPTPPAPRSLDTELYAAITLSRRPGVGAKRFRSLVDTHGSPQQALRALERKPPEARSSRDKSPLSQSQLTRIAQLSPDVGATWYGAPDYPRALLDLTEPPPYLFFKGPLFPLHREAIAVVGPRRCSTTGQRFAQTLAKRLAARGLAIVSGGALGIDAAAHQAALSAGGPAILVTATGIDRCYPAENEPLFREVGSRGCLLTELLPGTPPRRDFFPTRNRIIVGLAEAVIIVEGRVGSGTASSARQATRLGRPIFSFTTSTACSDPGALHRQLLTAHGASPLVEPEPELILRQIAATSA